MEPGAELHLKRVYDEPEPSDGYRVLVDRLWPRGMTAERAALGLWLAAVAPSHELRKRWHHDPERADEFGAQYRQELDENPAVDQLLQVLDEHPVVTLLYGARDRTVNHAVVLQRYLLERAAAHPPGTPGSAPSTGSSDG